MLTIPSLKWEHFRITVKFGTEPVVSKLNDKGKKSLFILPNVHE
jgi:hypothetical protein